MRDEETDLTASGHTTASALITFEGGEGAGKSTQLDRLATTLRRVSAHDVVTTREPGGTRRAEAIREFLLSGGAKPFGAFAEALCFSAARIDHLDTLIRPALAAGSLVLCDRFADSTRAYQGAAGGVPRDVLMALERVVVGKTRPALTLILDLPADVGLSRARRRGGEAAANGMQGAEPDRYETESLAFHQRLRQAFLDIAHAEPRRCVVIDAAREPDEVEAEIRAIVTRHLPHVLNTDSGRQSFGAHQGVRDDAA